MGRFKRITVGKKKNNKTEEQKTLRMGKGDDQWGKSVRNEKENNHF